MRFLTIVQSFARCKLSLLGRGTLLCRQLKHEFHCSTKMSDGSTSSALYAVVTNPTAAGAVPEDIKERSHHLKNGKGFVNPWPSYRQIAGPRIGMAMLW